MYINGILAPDMTLQRGKEYTFVVETGLGSDPDQTFHPLYITSDPIGNIQNHNVMEQSSFNTQNMTNPTIVSPVKMEYG